MSRPGRKGTVAPLPSEGPFFALSFSDISHGTGGSDRGIVVDLLIFQSSSSSSPSSIDGHVLDNGIADSSQARRE